MKKLFAVASLLLSISGNCQNDYKILLKSETYSINEISYNQPDILFTLTDSIINVRPIGNLKLIKKAASIKETSIYKCEYEGKAVEVITIIRRDNFKITVRGEDLNYIIKGDFNTISPKTGVQDLSKNKANHQQTRS